MTTPELFSMQSDDKTIELGTIFSASSEPLKRFGEAYMKDPKSKGGLIILDPKGQQIAAYDLWQSQWVEPSDTD